MTTPAPMTAEQIVEALCEAHSAVVAGVLAGDVDDSDVAHRDRIKAKLAAVLDDYAQADDAKCERLMRELEEACRGK